MRYSLSDLEHRFGSRPNARWSSIANELRREETAERLREEMQIRQIQWIIRTEEIEVEEAALRIANAVIADMPKQSYFDRLMRWFR